MAEDTFATQQYEAIRLYLDSFLQQQRGLAATQQRATAKDKMTRLTKQQFFDLSTDVYDEMNRRQANSNDGRYYFCIVSMPALIVCNLDKLKQAWCHKSIDIFPPFLRSYYSLSLLILLVFHCLVYRCHFFFNQII